MVTIKDIARESGYSVSTVSRVLNNRRDVSPKAKEIIEQIVAEHNFIPNNNAKHLKQTSSKSIAILVKGTSNMLFSDIVEEIQRMIEKTKYSVFVSYIDEFEDEVQFAVQLCWERKPLGMLFLGGNPDNFKDHFGNLQVPAVLVTNQGDKLELENLSSVATDDEKAAECAIDYLVEHGHTNIGIISGSLKHSDTSRQRYEGCLRSFTKHGIVFDEEKNLAKGRYSFESSYQAMKGLLEKNDGLTAVFAMSDVMAIGAIRALRDCGKNVPEDISVIGFDGIPLAEYYNPKLTTIKQQNDMLARRSVDILFGMVELNRPAVHEIVPFQLLEGESVAKI